MSPELKQRVRHGQGRPGVVHLDRPVYPVDEKARDTNKMKRHMRTLYHVIRMQEYLLPFDSLR